MNQAPPARRAQPWRPGLALLVHDLRPRRAHERARLARSGLLPPRSRRARRCTRTYRELKPAGLLGHGYGIVGTGLILTNLLYLVRRRFAKRIPAWMGSVKALARSARRSRGSSGSVLILFHSAFQLRTPIATVTSASLAIVVVTGLVGLYLLRARSEGGPQAAQRSAHGDRAAPPGARQAGARVRARRRRSRTLPADASFIRTHPHGTALGVPGRASAAEGIRKAARADKMFRVLEHNDASSRSAFYAELGDARGERGRHARGAALMRSWRSLHRFLAHPDDRERHRAHRRRVVLRVPVDLRMRLALVEPPLRALRRLLVSRARRARAAPLAGPALEGARLARGRPALQRLSQLRQARRSGTAASSATASSARACRGQGLHGRQYQGQAVRGVPRRAPRHRRLRSVAERQPDRASITRRRAGRSTARTRRACNKCHTKASQRGGPTYLGLSTTCSSCHKDLHTRPLRHDVHRVPRRHGVERAQPRRRSTTTWRTSSSRGAHTTVACAKCHSRSPPKYAGLKFEACTDCHKDPHAGKLGAELRGLPRGHAVEARHVQGREREAPGHRASRTGTRPSRARTCHDKGNLAAPSSGSGVRLVSQAGRTRRRSAPRAASCHGIDLVDRPPARRRARRAPEDGSTRSRASTRRSRCASLPQARAAARAARYRKLAFAPLHRLPRGQAQRRVREPSTSGECKTCHATSGFRPDALRRRGARVDEVPARRQAHRDAVLGCHKAPRPLVDLHVTKQVCADCHAEPARRPSSRREMAKGGCAQCHEPAGWHVPEDRSLDLAAHGRARDRAVRQLPPPDRRGPQVRSRRELPRRAAQLQRLPRRRAPRPVPAHAPRARVRQVPHDGGVQDPELRPPGA